MPRIRCRPVRLPFFGLLLLTACPSHAAAQEPAGGLQALPLNSLIARVDGEDRAIARAAFEEIVQRGPPIAPQLIAYLRHAPRPRNSIALKALLRTGQPGQRMLLEGLRGLGPDQLRNRLFELTLAAESAEIDVLPLAGELLQDSSVQFRSAGALMLVRPTYVGDMRDAFDPARQALLLAALADSSAEVRRSAAEALRRGAHLPAVVVQRLAELVAGDADATVRSRAALTLGWLRADPRSSVPVLIAAVKRDPDAGVRRQGAQSLAYLGPAAAAAVPALLQAAQGDDRRLRTAAIGALGDIGLAPPVDASAVLAAMPAALAHPDSATRRVTVSSLSRLDARATPLLIEALRDTSPEIGASAATALGERPPEAAAVDALFDALADPRTPLRDAAADALGGYGAELLPRLRALARQGSESARAGAERAVAYVEEATRVPAANRCYDLRRGPWEPHMEIGGDSVFSTSPDRIRFSTVGRRYEREGARRYSFVVERAGMQRGGWTTGSWRPLPGRNALEVVWSNGFSGVVLELEVDARGAVRGTARTFWDFTRSGQTAEITATPIPCPASAGGGGASP